MEERNSITKKKIWVKEEEGASPLFGENNGVERPVYLLRDLLTGEITLSQTDACGYTRKRTVR